MRGARALSRPMRMVSIRPAAMAAGGGSLAPCRTPLQVTAELSTGRLRSAVVAGAAAGGCQVGSSYVGASSTKQYVLYLHAAVQAVRSRLATRALDHTEQ